MTTAIIAYLYCSSCFALWIVVDDMPGLNRWLWALAWPIVWPIVLVLAIRKP
jgi:hypothetical protein